MPRERAPQEIVPAAEILDADALQAEEWNMRGLLANIDNGLLEFIKWLARRRLLSNTTTCTGCFQPCSFVGYAFSFKNLY